MSAIYVK